MKKLNTMDTFKDGFKIERDGKVYTLTPEEMSDFRYLDKAITGQDCIEFVLDDYDEDSDDYRVLQYMTNDEDICFNIENDILDILYRDYGLAERNVVEEYLERNK